MRSLSLVLLLLLAFSLAQAIPLQGGNDAVKCTLFGLIKTPVSQDPNSTQASLQLDVGLLGARNATYELVDSKDNVYKPGKYMSLQPGRTLLVFNVPEAALFKLLNVTPTDGKPFAINWWKTPKGVKGDLILRYYGVVDWVTQPDQQAVAYQVGIANNGTSTLAVSPENFTLLDQWGWPYYTMEGFTATEIEAKKAIKVNLVYGGLSPFSRPSMLVYDYATPNEVTIDLDKDMGQLTDAQVYGTAAPQNAQSTPTTASQTAMKPAVPAATSTSMPQTTMAQTIKPVIPAAPTLPQTTMSQAIKPVIPATSTLPQASTQGPSVTQKQTSSAASGSEKQTAQQTNESAQNRTKQSVLSLKDQINASKQRLSGLKGSLSSGQSSVGKEISASVEETRKRLEKMKQGLNSNQTQNNSTTNKTASK